MPASGVLCHERQNRQLILSMSEPSREPSVNRLIQFTQAPRVAGRRGEGNGIRVGVKTDMTTKRHDSLLDGMMAHRERSIIPQSHF